MPESQVEAENRRLNKVKETLKAQKAEIEAQLKASKDAVINVPKLEIFIERIQSGIARLDFEGKRQALEMLGITVYLDGDSVEITRTINLGIVLTPSSAGYSPFEIKIPLNPPLSQVKLSGGIPPGISS